VFEIDERVGLPEPFAQFVTADDLAGPFEQSGQHLPRLLLERYAFSLPIELAGHDVVLERPELQAWMRLAIHRFQGGLKV
jgi:hypothetical protein